MTEGQDPNLITQEQLAEAMEALKTELTESTNKTVTGALNKGLKATQSKISESLQAELAPVLAALTPKASNQDPDAQQGNSAAIASSTEGDGKTKATTSDLAEGMAQFQQQLKQLQTQNETLTQKLVEQQQLTAQQAEKAALTELARQKATYQAGFQSAVSSQLNESVKPDVFFDVIVKQTGAQFDQESGRYVVPGQDDFGNATATPLEDLAGGFLKENPYFAKPRPGSGTGSNTSNGSNAQSNGQSLLDSAKGKERFTDLALNSADPIGAMMAEVMKKQAG